MLKSPISNMPRFVRANSGAKLSRELKRNRKKGKMFLGDAKLLMTFTNFYDLHNYDIPQFFLPQSPLSSHPIFFSFFFSSNLAVSRCGLFNWTIHRIIQWEDLPLYCHRWHGLDHSKFRFDGLKPILWYSLELKRYHYFIGMMK